MKDLPSEIQSLLGDVPVLVKDWPDERILADMEIDDALQLTGLYCAVPIGERHAMGFPPVEPERIELYRMPILFEWCHRNVTLHDVVFDVLTHEIGHHLGMDEDSVLRMEER